MEGRPSPLGLYYQLAKAAGGGPFPSKEQSIVLRNGPRCKVRGISSRTVSYTIQNKVVRG